MSCAVCDRCQEGEADSVAGANAPPQEPVHALDEKIFLFVESLSPININDPQAARCDQISTHAVAYSSLILLHDPVVRNDAIAYERCLFAARLISNLMGHLQQGDAVFLNPFVTVSFRYEQLQSSVLRLICPIRHAVRSRARSLFVNLSDQEANHKHLRVRMSRQ